MRLESEERYIAGPLIRAIGKASLPGLEGGRKFAKVTDMPLVEASQISVSLPHFPSSQSSAKTIVV